MGRFDAAEAQLATGFEAVDGIGADAELTDLHYIRLQLLARQVDLAGLEEEAVALLALAERAGTRQAVAGAAAHLALADVAFLRGRWTVARERGLQALAVAEQAELSALAVATHRHLALTAINVGDHRLAREHALADLALARQTGSPTLELGARFLLLATDLVIDAWDGVLRDADELLALGYRVGYARGVATALAGRAFVFAHRGRPEDAARCVAEAREVYGGAAAADRHIFTVIEIADAAAALAAGDPARARALAAAAVATPTTLPCLGLALLGEAQVAAGDPAGALGTARRLARLGPDAPWPAACGIWIEGLARAGLGERAAALACLRRAADRLDGLGLPFQAARAWLDWAEVAAAVRADDSQSCRLGRMWSRRLAGAWPPSTGSAPARSPTGPAGCYAPWGSGRPRLQGRRPASCRSESCRWFAWSPSGSAMPRSPGGCSSVPGPSPPTCSTSMAGSGSPRARR